VLGGSLRNAPINPAVEIAPTHTSSPISRLMSRPSVGSLAESKSMMAGVREPNLANQPIGCGCGDTWMGSVRAHCGECHQTFDESQLFDLHRIDGYCQNPRGLGMALRGSVWYERTSSSASASADLASAGIRRDTHSAARSNCAATDRPSVQRRATARGGSAVL